jgi:hypothetical protein
MAAPANSETGSDSPAAKVAHVEQVSVHPGDTADAGLTVEIQTSGARVAPNTQVITDPDRIIVDFPGALPAAALHALKVNEGALTGVRTGLFFNNPPITRVVLDLAEPQSYQISTTGNGVVVKLSPAKVNSAKTSAKTNAGTPNPDAPNSNSPSPTAQNSGVPNSGGPNSGTINPVNSNSVKLNPAQSSPAKSSLANSSPVQSNAVKSNPATLKSVKSTAAGTAKLNSAKLSLDLGAGVVIERYPIAPGARTPMSAPATTAIVATAPKPAAASPARGIGPVGPNVATVNIPTVNAATVDVPTVSVPQVISEAAAAPPLDPIAEEGAPPKPAMSVTFANGMLSIRTEKATLAQVLYEVQRQTQAEIAIPAGAEQEEVAANLGPAAARDVLASLLNGSGYNFIFIGSQERLERVILTLRDPNIF